MRATLKYFLARLGLVAFATLGLSAATFGHDLPDVEALAKAHAAFTQPTDAIAVARPDAGVAPRPALSDARSNDAIAVAQPDVGAAPRPVVKVAQAVSATQLNSSASLSARASEVYMPYDFQLSDWRFGQFPYHGITATAPSPMSLPSLTHGIADVPVGGQPAEAPLFVESLSETIPTKGPAPQITVKYGPRSSQSVALGEFLQQLEQWQCTAYSVLADGATLARSVDRISQSWGVLAVNYRQAYFASDLSAAAASVPSLKQPLPTVGPQFVVYDSALGGHIVLTVEQARDWQFEAPVTRSQIDKALGAAFKPIQSSVLASASRQLEFAGRGLLSLSRGLSSLASVDEAETKVASLPGR